MVRDQNNGNPGKIQQNLLCAVLTTAVLTAVLLGWAGEWMGGWLRGWVGYWLVTSGWVLVGWYTRPADDWFCPRALHGTTSFLEITPWTSLISSV